MTFDEFLPYVLVELPECPVPTLINETGTVLDDFCRDTLCWTETLDPVIMRSGVDVYDFDAPAGSIVHMVQSMHADGVEMDVTDRKKLFRETPDWLTRTSTAPDKFIRLSIREFQVTPKPAVTGSVVLVDAILVPQLPITALPDAVMLEHLQAIAAGVRYRLMAKANVPWSNPTMAVFYKGQYDEKVNAAIARRMHGHSTGDVYVQPQRFGFSNR